MLYATRHCVAVQRLITLLSLLHYNIVLLVPSAFPHIKVILPPNSTSQEVTLFSFTSFIHYGNGGYQFQKKTKSFLLLSLSCPHKYVCIQIPVFITVYSYFTLP